MKRIALLFFMLCYTLILSNASAAWRPGEMLVRVQLNTESDFRALVALKLNIDNVKPNGATVFVTPEELKSLQNLEYFTEIVIPSMEAYSRELLSNPEFVVYHDYNSTRTLVDSLVNAYPQLIRKQIYGYSILGRELYAVKISDNVAVDEDEPEVSFDGGHHGDEIMGAEVIILLMRELCNAYGTDTQITRLVNTREIWIFPFINPDGRMSMSRYNNAGVDVNRDWGYMWDLESPAIFSQPESRAGRDWINDHQFVISQTNHGGTESISYPWSYRPNQCPDHYPIDFLAAGYSSNSGYVPTLPYFQGYNGMYPINGSAKDAFYGLMGSVGWTMEVSLSKQPSAALIPQYYNWNRPAMLYLLEMAGKGVKGMVTDAGSGDGIPAVVWIRNTGNQYMPVYSDPVVGDFHKFVLPGTYTVKVTANGYQSATFTNVTVQDTGATPLNFQLQPQTATYAYRVVMSRIPGNNYNDEGFTPASLAAPDNVNYSLGRSGYIVLDMGETISDFSGDDFRVIEGDASPEGYTVRVSNTWNGPWALVGTGTGTTAFDLQGSGMTEFRYIKIEDDGDGLSSVADAGFDLDAVEGRLIPPTGPFIMATEYTIEDSASNGNQTLEAGETASIQLMLENMGVDGATNVWVVTRSGSGYLSVDYDSISAGGIASGQSIFMLPVTITAAPGTPDHSLQNLIIDIYADGGYHWNHTLPVLVEKGPEIASSENSVVFPNTFIGSTVEMPLHFRNMGMDSLLINEFDLSLPQFQLDESGLALAPGEQQEVHLHFLPDDTLNYLDTLKVYSNDPVNFVLQIPLSGKGVLAPVIQISTDSIFTQLLPDDSTVVPVTIYNNGAGELVFTAQVGNYQPGNTEDTGGNDRYGHIWIDSDEQGGPQFDWLELGNGTGTEIPVSGLNVTSNSIDLGFTLSFYGKDYSSLRVCSNGWISFSTYSVSYNNTALPSILAPRSMIAPLWDNLNMQTDSRLYYKNESDRFIVQWDKMYTAGGLGPYTFELIIYENGNVIMQYETLSGIDSTYTTGMQNQNADDGFYIAYNENYLHDNMSILISRRSWVQVNPVGGTIAPGSQADISVSLNSRDFPMGDFWSSVQIFSNDPLQSNITIPIHLKVDSLSTGIETAELLPEAYQLYQNYPNPFNPQTRIRYDLKQSGDVTLTIYNLLGQEVRTLLRGRENAGRRAVIWNGKNNDGAVVASGIYIYRLVSTQPGGEKFVKTRKMIFMK